MVLKVKKNSLYIRTYLTYLSSSDLDWARLSITETKVKSMSGWLLQWISLQKHIMRPGRRVRSFWREVFSRKFKFCEISKILEFSLTCALCFLLPTCLFLLTHNRIFVILEFYVVSESLLLIKKGKQSMVLFPFPIDVRDIHINPLKQFKGRHA